MADRDDDVLHRMMANNRVWAEQINRENPGFFDRLSKQQTPRVLWIGSSDSRSPIVPQAWRRGQAVSVHGWIYNLESGPLRDLDIAVHEDWQAGPTLDAAFTGPRPAVKALE